MVRNLRPAPVDRADLERLASFRFALRQFLHFSTTAAREAGLTAQQHQALLAIKGYPGRDRATIGELADRLMLRHHSTVGLVDRLAQMGLVKRQADEHDRRFVWIALTADGEAALDRLSAAHIEELRRIGPILAELLEEFGGA